MGQRLDEILLSHERKREELLPLLYEAQKMDGWLPRERQEAVSRRLGIPLADVHSVVEFYSMLYNRPTARRVIRVCQDVMCQQRGAAAVMVALERELGLRPGETDEKAAITYERVPCLGMCEHGPCALNGEKPAGDLTEDDVIDFLKGDYPEPSVKIYGHPLLALARVGKIDPGSLAEYEANGGYRALRKAVVSPEEVIANVEESGILGRGGAMFPTGRKWRFTRGAAGSVKHVVVNADESEPGTFKDRVILEEDPFAVIEAATLAGYAIGAQYGWIFVRGEYPRAYRRLEAAVDAAHAAGYLGQDILGQKGFDFDIQLRKGAGAYICGEETALFEAIEGKLGYPRAKPPFPTTHGLFQQPTVINNVETLVASMISFDMGAENWRKLGTAQSPGTKLFCLSGDVARPGVYEMPFGVTVRELIELAGDTKSGTTIQAVLMGGAAGKFIGPDNLDLPLTYEDSRARGVPLGSGAVMVFGESADMRRALLQISRFFAHESCGKCYPCRLGTRQQQEILERAAMNGGGRPGDRQILPQVGMAMKRASFCGLGQTASSAIMSAVELWPQLVN